MFVTDLRHLLDICGNDFCMHMHLALLHVCDEFLEPSELFGASDSWLTIGVVSLSR
jgi:hypothetical protein